MTPQEFYTQTPSDWIKILRFVRDLQEGLSRGLAHKVSPYPNLGRHKTLEGSIYDPNIFGTVDGDNGGWGHIRVRNVVHPACIEKIAELLGLTPLQVRQVAWWQGTIWPDGRFATRPYMTGLRSGPAFLRKQLERLATPPDLEELGFTPSDLVLDILPVPPRNVRPSVAAPGGLLRAGSDDMIYNALVLQAGIINFFQDSQGSESPGLSLLFEEQSVLPLQRLLEQLIHTYSVGRAQSRWELEKSWMMQMPLEFEGGSGADQDLPEFPDVALPEMLPTEVDEVRQRIEQSKVPLRLLPLANQLLWVQYIDRAELRRWPGGEVVETRPTKGRLLGMDASEQYLVYLLMGHLLVHDYASQQWLEAFPGEDFVFADAFDQESGYMCSLGKGELIRLLELRDAPVEVVRSRDGKFLWLEDKDANGGIYGADSGWLLAEPGFLELPHDPPFLTPDGAVTVLSRSAMEIMEEVLQESIRSYEELALDSELQQTAFCLRADQWWIFAFNILWIDQKAIWRTDMPITCAGFSEDHRHLFLANREEIRILRLNGLGHPEHLERIALP